MKLLKSTIILLIIALTWHWMAEGNIIDKEFFPSPFFIIKKLFELIRTEAFLNDLRSSSLRLLSGTLISIPLSLLSAIFCFRSKIIDHILTPVIGFTYPLPKVAIIPLLMLVFGIGDGFKIAVISLGMFYLIFINVYTSLTKLKNSQLNDVAKVYQLAGKNYYLQFLLKGIALDFLVGLKMALGYALTLVVVSEFSMSKNGIGNFIWKAWDQFKVIDMYAGIFLLCLAGLVIYSALDFIIGRLTKYYSV